MNIARRLLLAGLIAAVAATVPLVSMAQERLAVIGTLQELIRDLLPGISRVGYLNWAANAFSITDFVDEAVDAAALLGFTLIIADILVAEDIDGAFAKLVSEGVEAVALDGGPVINVEARDQISSLGAAAGLPLFAINSGGRVEDGSSLAVMSTTDVAERWRVRAEYIVKILEGAQPGDLPIFTTGLNARLYINLNTARILGIEFPPNILALADVVYPVLDDPVEEVAKAPE